MPGGSEPIQVDAVPEKDANARDPNHPSSDDSDEPPGVFKPLSGLQERAFALAYDDKSSPKSGLQPRATAGAAHWALEKRGLMNFCHVGPVWHTDERLQRCRQQRTVS